MDTRFKICVVFVLGELIGYGVGRAVMFSSEPFAYQEPPESWRPYDEPSAVAKCSNEGINIDALATALNDPAPFRIYYFSELEHHNALRQDQDSWSVPPIALSRYSDHEWDARDLAELARRYSDHEVSPE